MFTASMFQPESLNKAVPYHAPNNGGRSPESVLGSDGTAIRPSTSGTPTRLAENRHATRPGAGRHPQTGQFTRGQGIAAGHSSLDQQPASRDARLSAPATTRLGNAPGQAESTIAHHLARHMAGAAVQSADLRGPSGMPAFAHPVQSPDAAGSVGHHLGQNPGNTPGAGAARTPVPLMHRAEAYPVPGMSTQAAPAFLGGMTPQPAFGGLVPSDVTLSGPGW